jgi:uncharacterized protein YdhG (YjbR/CyaY superfamily)
LNVAITPSLSRLYTPGKCKNVGNIVLSFKKTNQIMPTEKIKFQSAAEYIQSFPKEKQEVLKKIQATLKKAVPEGEEVISYGIPAVKYHGWVFYYSMYTSHFSLSCPPPWNVFDAFKKELAGYKISKSTIQFPLDQPVPVKLIDAMAKFRAKENFESEKKKKK